MTIDALPAKTIKKIAHTSYVALTPAAPNGT
jgi:hypothetical protein